MISALNAWESMKAILIMLLYVTLSVNATTLVFYVSIITIIGSKHQHDILSYM